MDLQPLSSPMAIDSMPTSPRKRRADDLELDQECQNTTLNEPSAPHIIQRHRNRRRNVAASAWSSTCSIPGPLSVPYRPVPAEPFNIYKAILRHPHLFFQFALRLPYRAIMDLYAIDKEFHYRLNKYSVSLIHDYAKYHAPLASYIFSWILYPDLCISDPMLRPMDGRPHLARDVPGFRWVKMILWRQGIVKGILTELGMDGLRVPRKVEGVLMKFWVLMEIKSTAVREAFLKDISVWSDTDILYFHIFLVKLDMFFSHPVQGNGVCELSHMLLTQKSLSSLYDILLGKTKLDYDDCTDMVVLTYLSEDLDTDTHPWLDDEIENGIPEENWGLLCREGWDMDGRRMESVVDMVVMEGIQRGLNMQRHLPELLLYGFVCGKTSENVSRPRKWRWDQQTVVPLESWPVEKERVKMIDRIDKRLGIEKKEEGVFV